MAPRAPIEQPPSTWISLGMPIVAILMVLFGAAEIVTGFRHEFFGLTTAQVAAATYVGAALGLLYVAGGLMLLLRRKWAAVAALACLILDVMGRIAMVVTGLFPIAPLRQAIGIVAGTVIAIVFAVYVAGNLRRLP